jgi:tetratricopeptide (TPR) repeat protein
MGEGEFALVRQHLELSVSQTAEWLGDHDQYTTLAEVAALQRDEAAIRKFAARAEALADNLGHAPYQGIIHRAWGVAHRLAGEYDESQSRLDRALEIFMGMNARWQLGLTQFEVGELALARQQPAAARDAYRRALENFEAMKARPFAERTRAALAVLE